MTTPTVRSARIEAARAFTTVEVFFEVAPVLAAWADLETAAPCSIYQTRAWLVPWIEAFAGPERLQPFYALARDGAGRPAALLCLGLRRRGPTRVALCLGGRDANFNLPLLAPGAPWSRAELRRLLRDAARRLGRAAPDLYALTSQPFAWNGIANPLAQLRHQPSPSFAYGTALIADADAFLAAKLSKDSRKKLRKKEARLAAAGPVTHEVVRGRVALEAAVDRFVALRNARFRDQGIRSPFEAPEMRDFIVAACVGEPPGVDLHVLKVAQRIVAVYGGAAHQGQWSGMFNAFDMDPEIAASSPGELLLTRIAAQVCRGGSARLDLGIGTARYKAALCDEEIALFDAFVPMTPAGRLMALAIGARQMAKRFVKSDPRLFALAKRLNGWR